MAKWTVTPGSINNTMNTQVRVENGEDLHWEVEQDINPVLEDIKHYQDNRDTKKEMQSGGMRKMATIPDIVAIEMLNKHNLDLHDPLFMNNPANLKRLRYLLRTEYPYLLIST